MACAAVLALFPGTFIYHVLAAFGVMPMFLGGWWGAISVLFGATFVPLLIASAVQSRHYQRHLIFCVLCAMVVFYAAYYRVWGQPWQRSDEAALAAIALLAGWACFYGIGWFVNIRPGASFAWALLACWGGMALGVVCLLDPITRSFDLQAQFQNSNLADYKFLAGCFSIVALLCIGATSSAKAKGAILALSTAILYLMTARAEMSAVFGVGVIWGILHAREGNWVAPILAAAVFCLLMLLITAPLPLPSLYVGHGLTRAPIAYAELLNIGESQSGRARLEMLVRGLRDIASSPIFGIYAGQTADGSGWGTYIHNMLEAWRQFGIVSFVAYAVLIISAFVSACRWRLAGGQSFDMIFAVALYVAGLCVVANGVFWLAPALAWGLIARVRTSTDSCGIPTFSSNPKQAS